MKGGVRQEERRKEKRRTEEGTNRKRWKGFSFGRGPSLQSGWACAQYTGRKMIYLHSKSLLCNTVDFSLPFN